MAQKITRQALTNVYDTLGTLKEGFNEAFHRFTAIALRKQLEVIVSPFTEMRSDVIKKQPVDFEKKRQTLCHTYAEKDEKGEPKTENNQFVLVPKTRKEFEEKWAALQEEYKKPMEDFKEEADKFAAFMVEEIDMPKISSKIPVSWLNAKVSMEQIEVLFPILKDDVTPDEERLSLEKTKAVKKK